MTIYALNGFGTNAPGINGLTNQPAMNGTNAPGINGTTNQPSMNCTACESLQGYLDESVAIPVRTSRGVVYVSPLALMDENDVPMQGVPEDWSEDERQYYQLGYLLGDEDHINGLFSRIREKFQERRERKEAKRADRDQRRALRRERAKTGGRFIDKFGNALSNIGEGYKLKAQAEADANDAGINPDDEILTQRAALANEFGGGGGIAGFWSGLGTPAKVLVVLGVLGIAYAAYRYFSKKRKKR